MKAQQIWLLSLTTLRASWGIIFTHGKVISGPHFDYFVVHAIHNKHKANGSSSIDGGPRQPGTEKWASFHLHPRQGINTTFGQQHAGLFGRCGVVMLEGVCRAFGYIDVLPMHVCKQRGDEGTIRGHVRPATATCLPGRLSRRGGPHAALTVGIMDKALL